MSSKPLEGLIVIALEQAVAAPYCSSKLADAGARVIKIEGPEGDFARSYDSAVFGESSYFVWINRGKESVALDLRDDAGKKTLRDLLASADVFIQNLAHGAANRLGFGTQELRDQHPRLITCDITGYGESGPVHQLKAYDLLVQAESGLVSVSGAPGPWGRIGVSICDITAGMNALIGVQQALLQRERTGHGSSVKVSLFDSAAELMTVPYLQARYGTGAPERVGLKHAGISPYGAFICSDGREVLISIQNEREWSSFCKIVLEMESIANDPRFIGNQGRTHNCNVLDEAVQAIFSQLTYAEVIDRLTEAQTPYGAINSVHDLISHPQLRTREMVVGGRPVQVPASPFVMEWDDPVFRQMPRINEHGELPVPDRLTTN